MLQPTPISQIPLAIPVRPTPCRREIAQDIRQSPGILHRGGGGSVQDKSVRKEDVAAADPGT